MKRIISLFLILAMHSVVILAQNEEVTLRGTVIDETSEPVIGASVYVKDRPGVGSTTNLDGEFTLKVNRST